MAEEMITNEEMCGNEEATAINYDVDDKQVMADEIESSRSNISASCSNEPVMSADDRLSSEIISSRSNDDGNEDATAGAPPFTKLQEMMLQR
jgi:hypothetical protein